MKLPGIIILPAMFAIVICVGSRPIPAPGGTSLQQWCREAFTADSGYINSAQGCRLIRLICATDTTVFTSPYCQYFSTDTLPCGAPVVPDSMGKYYRVPLPDGGVRWVLCLTVAVYWEMPYVFEIRQEKDDFTMSGWNVYPHGNYACCWYAPLSGFYRTGPYFFIETCGTGSAFCSGTADVVFFPLSDSADPVAEPASIPVYYYEGGGDYDDLLSSRQFLSGDTLVVDYTFERDTVERAATPCRNCRKSYRFRGLFKIDAQKRQMELLNRDSVLRHEEPRWMFE